YLAVAINFLRHMPRELILLLAPTLLHELAVAASFLIRRPLRMQLQGLGPALAGYGGALILLVFFPVARAWFPSWITRTESPPMVAAGLALWVFGAVIGLGSIWFLRHSFSLVPQARALVTHGPYRFARHPIYGAYIPQNLGIWLLYPTLPLALAILAWVGLQLLRIHYEEKVLTAAFPEYAGYRKNVGAFGPRLFSTHRRGDAERS
ncbi:MAG: methyltransferase family protein, partial [Terriglobales bacterium]